MTILDALAKLFKSHNEKLLSSVKYRPVSLLGESQACGAISIFDQLLHEYRINEHRLVSVNPTLELHRYYPDALNKVFAQNLFVSFSEPKKDIPLRNVCCISSSKTDLRKYADIESFGEATYRAYRNKPFLTELSEEEYISTILKDALRDSNQYFEQYPWHTGLKFANSDGSHRLAGAWYTDFKHELNTYIPAKIKQYAFNIPWVRALCSLYTVYIMNFDSIDSLINARDAFNTNHPLYAGAFIDLNNLRYGESTRAVLFIYPKQKRWPRYAVDHIKTYCQNDLWIELATAISNLQKNKEPRPSWAERI